MTASRFRSNVLGVICVYVLMLTAGILLRVWFPGKDAPEYTTFKDLVPLAIAIPAAWLGYCFQRRQAFIKDVRDLWSKLVNATQEAVQYTHIQTPSQSEFAKVQKTLSVAIEEVRGVFTNIGESEENIGYFPFDGIKDIQRIISSLYFGEAVSIEKSTASRAEIIAKWKELRKKFLADCARGAPMRPDNRYLQ